MKIALFVHCFFPEHFYGTETYTLELATNLQAMGHEPIIVTAVFQDEARRDSAITCYEYNGLTVYCFDKNYCRHSWVRETYYQPEAKPFLREILDIVQPDLIHVTHLVNHTAAILEVAKEKVIPVVATFTDFFGFCFNNKLEAADGSLCIGPNDRRTNCVACLLKAEASLPAAGKLKSLIGSYPWSRMAAELLGLAARAPVTVNWRKVAKIRDMMNRSDLLMKLYSLYREAIAPSRFLYDAYLANGLAGPMTLSHFGTDIDRRPKPVRSVGSLIRFGFIGQIAPHKGTSLLVEAFCRLPRGQAELHIYGPENQAPAYMASLRSHAQGYAISFHGTFPKEDLADVLSELDFLVIPSIWYENSPLVLLNALASHTPVIVSNVAGMTEFVEVGKNGFIFEMGSVADLEKVLQEIVNESEKSLNLKSTTDYLRTTREMAEDVVEIYKRLLSKKHQ